MKRLRYTAGGAEPRRKMTLRRFTTGRTAAERDLGNNNPRYGTRAALADLIAAGAHLYIYVYMYNVIARFPARVTML